MRPERLASPLPDGPRGDRPRLFAADAKGTGHELTQAIRTHFADMHPRFVGAIVKRLAQVYEKDHWSIRLGRNAEQLFPMDPRDVRTRPTVDAIVKLVEQQRRVQREAVELYPFDRLFPGDEPVGYARIHAALEREDGLAAARVPPVLAKQLRSRLAQRLFLYREGDAITLRAWPAAAAYLRTMRENLIDWATRYDPAFPPDSLSMVFDQLEVAPRSQRGWAEQETENETIRVLQMYLEHLRDSQRSD